MHEDEENLAGYNSLQSHVTPLTSSVPPFHHATYTSALYTSLTCLGKSYSFSLSYDQAMTYMPQWVSSSVVGSAGLLITYLHILLSCRHRPLPDLGLFLVAGPSIKYYTAKRKPTSSVLRFLPSPAIVTAPTAKGALSSPKREELPLGRVRMLR